MKKTAMKKADQQTLKSIAEHPEAIMQALPPGFIILRLNAEIQQLAADSRKLGALYQALDKLSEKPGYEKLDTDMREALGLKSQETEAVPEAPAVEEKAGWWRRMVG